MPKEVRKDFRTNGVRAHIRKRLRGNSVNYEVRCRRNGYNISASGVTVEEAKQRFIQKLNECQYGVLSAEPLPTTFEKFIAYYFDNFRKRKVTSKTFLIDSQRVKRHILPRFSALQLKQITSPMCQQLIDGLISEGKGKTAEEVYSLLNCTFKTAIKLGALKQNPLDLVICDKHQRKHGKALTIEEEQHLLKKAEEPYKTLFAIGLYTGLRPNEYETIRIIDNFVYAKNSKRKGGKDEQKRIPITPMLRPYITNITVIPKKTPAKLRNAFKAIFGEAHKLYDLRTTFYTRCQMCDISPVARDEFVGHSSGELSNAYTDLPDDFLLKEGQKLCY